MEIEGEAAVLCMFARGKEERMDLSIQQVKI